jgi:SAM-dependent MidA family methyltransferase
MQQRGSFSLPRPDAASAAHSNRVASFIRDAIGTAGGSISFAEYMHHCLYAPGLGYYAAGSRNFGRSGDFVTAPEVSAVFGAIVARQCVEVIGRDAAGGILELGAGSGKLAADILRELSRLDETMACDYTILEVAADLRERQETRLRREVPDTVDRVRWADELPVDFRGVMIANEVLDALPVERFVRRGDGVFQVRVATKGDAFELIERPAPDVLADAVDRIEESLGHPLTDGYRSEICLAAPQWIGDLAASLADGVILLFDYGVGRHEYYAPERNGGWLRCHFRHHAHDDPLILPGIQDLTAWVDFTAVAEAAIASGIEVGGFATQAQFLIGGGIDRYLANFADLPTDAQLKLSAEIKLLTLPSEMGEHFKCLALCRGEARLPAAFNFADRTASLG